MDMQSKPKVIASIADLEKASMPYAQKLARDYWQSGANEMLTVAENKSAFDYYKIRTKVMTDVSKLNTKPKTTLFGKTYSVPIGIAPSAFHQMATDEGEVATAKAALSRDVPLTLSSYSNKSLEEVKAAGGDSVVFMQLYVFQNRATTEKLVRRAEKAGYKAIALTVDTPMIGKRFADEYNEFKLPGYLKLGNFESAASGPIDIGMTPGSASKKAMAAENEEQDAPTTTSEANAIDPRLNWAETIPWLRSITKLEIWAKGIATAEDTEAAIAAGIDGIWISNHGGRQLDSTLATIDSLPEVVEAAKGRVPVHVDGGFRRGGDVFKALALGADFVWLGRPVLYGLQYDGQKGVELALDIIREEFKYVMAMTGTVETSSINRKQLVRIGPAIQKL
ncbi:hypothetical protein D0Z00_003447 [Geotrichum galactomycetum]|uniref:Uncharacterized protein n=1 Tax=Geotrichum galactomycetum TaxID=27317 RepID=A0ACB6V1A1_9ASCO|nr:hypothetical protein D0Z00_003447 [Geotrichum candidum]